MTTQSQDTPAILARLEKLEADSFRLVRQNRQWRLVALLASMLAASAIFVPAAVSQGPKSWIITAEGFILVDSAGKLRATFAVVAGQPWFDLAGPDGKPRVSLTVMKDGSAGLSLDDDHGKTRASLLLTEGSPELSLFNADGKTPAKLRALKNGTPALTLQDDAGKTRLALAVFGDQHGLFLNGANGKEQASLAVLQRSPLLALSYPNDKPGVILALTKNESPGLSLIDKNEKVRANLSLGSEGSPSLFLSDAIGKSLFSRP